MSRAEMLANYLIGAAGAFGQAMLLQHTLASYPFKILSSPPGRFYATVGVVLGYLSPALALIGLKIFHKTPAPFVTAIPVVACPLVFFVLFRVIFILSGHHYPLQGNDVIATSATEAGFVNEVLLLTLLGLTGGIVCGVVLGYIFGRFNRDERILS